MKNILVPTDFSACASDAAEVAFQLAERFDAKVHFFSNLTIDPKFLEASESERENYPEVLQTIYNTNILFKDLAKKAQIKNIEFEARWNGGKLVDNVKNYVQLYNIDFIVMGSHGTSGKNEFFIGSNTQKVVRVVHCPVLIVKDEIKIFDLKKVVFASTYNPEDKAILQYLLNLVKPYKPEIHLLEVNTSSWFSQPYILVKESMRDFKEMCHGFEVKTHFFRDWTVEAGIRHMTEEIGADLVAISNMKRNPLKRIFAGSNVEALLNHSSIPVLSIDFPKVEQKPVEVKSPFREVSYTE